MATGSRTLKLSILGDVDQLNKSLKAANTDVNNSANQISEFGKKAAIAFAVAGTAALAFAADAVKAAVLDEAAQAKLAETIKATTNATAAQVAGVEDYITKTSIAIGVTDDELRPAFARLVRSTKDTEDAQRLLNLSLDLAAVVGKPVETVANALGKAYDGNTTALGKLGLGLDANLLKSKDNKAIIEQLETTYGRFAEGAAETTAKKFERIKIATSEAKEAIGAALLPVVQKLADYLLVTVVPNLESFINGLTGKGGLKQATDNATASAYKWGEQIKRVFTTVVNFKDELIAVSIVIAGVFVVSKVTAAVQATITLIKGLILAYNALKASALVAGVASAFALNPLLGVGAVALAAGVLAGANALANNNNVELPSSVGLGFPSGFTSTEVPTIPIPTPPKISPPTVSGSSSATAAVAASSKLIFDATANLVPTVTIGGAPAGYTQELFKPTVTIGGAPAGYQSNALQPQVTVNMGVVGDPEAAARTIVNTVNDAFYRGTGGATAFRIEK
jgi:hypothetical protein